MTRDDFKEKPINDNILMVEVGQSLDNNNAEDMVDLISSAQSRGVCKIILDMSETEFLSSAGVGAILGSIERSREMGGDIVLCNLTEGVLQVLNILDLADFLTIHAGEEEAIAQCSLET